MRADRWLASLVLGGIVLALWPPPIPGSEGVRRRIVLLDRSASVERPGSEAILALAAEEVLVDLGPRDEVAFVAFGDGAMLLAGFEQASSWGPSRVRELLSVPHAELRGASAIDPRVEAVLEALRREHPGAEVVVVGDGTLTSPAPEGAVWSAVVPPLPAPNDVGLRFEGLPRRLAPRETFDVAVRVGSRADRALTVRVRWTSRSGDGAGSRTRTLELGPGGSLRCVERFTAPEAGALELEVVLEAPPGDDLPENDRDAARLTVGGGRRFAWVAERPLPRELAGSGPWESIEPSGLPTLDLDLHDLVWLDDVDVRSLSASRFERYVLAGGVLVVSAAGRQFEGGGYDREPWARLLPVHPDPDEAPRHVLVALDHSGSMGRDGERKLRAAHLAVDGLAAHWGRLARVEVATFAAELAPPVLLKEPGEPVARPLRERLGEPRARGETRLAQALERAAALLPAAEVRPVWLVAVTDGEEQDPEAIDPQVAERVGRRLDQRGVDVLLLAVGPKEAGLDGHLRALAGPRGRVLWVEETRDLPATLRRGVSWARERHGASSVGRTAAAPPEIGEPARSLARLRRARLRPEATAWLALSADPGRGDPVLALWALGRGRVAWWGTAWEDGVGDLVRTAGARWFDSLLRPAEGARLELAAGGTARATTPGIADDVGALQLVGDDGRRSLWLPRIGAERFEGALGDGWSPGAALELRGPTGRTLAVDWVPEALRPEFDPGAVTHPYPVAWSSPSGSAPPPEGRRAWRAWALAAWILAHVFVWRCGRPSRPATARPKDR